MKTLVLGLGNEIKKDDAVGPILVRKLSEKLDDEDMDFKTSASGRILLLDEIRGYDRVFLIDSIKTEEGKPGVLYYLEPDDLDQESGLFASHNVGLRTMKQIGSSLGMKMPEIKIIAVEVENPFEFEEGLTESLQNRLPDLIEEIRETICGKS
ncbi:MAG: hydrogenase maturation protease [Candidatus Hadarchaeia archaeon]